MKTAFTVLLASCVALLACGAEEAEGEYLKGGLWETSVTMEDYVNPGMSEEERAAAIDIAKSRQAGSTSACRPAFANRLSPKVGTPFQMGPDSVCQYFKVEATGEPADRLVKCTAPTALVVELKGEVRSDFIDLHIKTYSPDRPDIYAVTHEISRLTGVCPENGAGA